MRFVFPREVLLVEVGRWCREPACGAPVRLSLTKQQARAYTGFECGRCGRWYWDTLAARDIPEWWKELRGTAPEGLAPELGSRRPAPESLGAVEKPAGKSDAEQPERKSVNKPVNKPAWGAAEDEEGADVGEVVARLSEAWRRMGGKRERRPEAAEPEREDSF